MCSRLGANAPKNFIAIAIVDKDIEGVYNKNRGIKMDKNFRTLLVLWMVLAICWLFLRIGTDIHKTRVINERLERASEQASEREKENERNLEKLRQEFRKEFGKEPSF